MSFQINAIKDNLTPHLHFTLRLMILAFVTCTAMAFIPASVSAQDFSRRLTERLAGDNKIQDYLEADFE